MKGHSMWQKQFYNVADHVDDTPPFIDELLYCTVSSMHQQDSKSKGYRTVDHYVEDGGYIAC